MKKILISILVVLLLILSYFVIWHGIKFIKVESIKDIKSASSKLDKDIEESTVLATQTYPKEIDGLDEAINKLKISKQEYENKSKYNTENGSIGAVEIKTYKVHFLWTILGNYSKENGMSSLNLDLKTTSAKDVYNLQFTLIGNYVAITDYIYDIENDEQLNFEIKNFAITSANNVDTTNNATNTVANSNSNIISNSTNKNETNTTSANKNNVKKDDGTMLKATFTVEDIGITLD